jgi:hypothetical protein
MSHVLALLLNLGVQCLDGLALLVHVGGQCRDGLALLVHVGGQCRDGLALRVYSGVQSSDLVVDLMPSEAQRLEVYYIHGLTGMHSVQDSHSPGC